MCKLCQLAITQAAQRSVTHVQEAVLDGIGAEGPPASTVVDRLLRTDALAQWVAVNEVAPTSPCILTPMLCRIC